MSARNEFKFLARSGVTRGLLWVLLSVALSCQATDPQTLDNSLRRAIVERDTDSIDLLLSAGADPGVQTRSGRSALMVAAHADDVRLVRRLLLGDVDVAQRNRNGGTALMFAAVAGALHSVELLVEHGAAVNQTSNLGWNAIMLAAVKDHQRVVSYLLAHGADPNLADVYGSTTLSRAVEEGRLATVWVLLEDGRAHVNTTDDHGATPLHYAAAREDVALCELLLDHGADAGIENLDGQTPVDVARALDNPVLLTLLERARETTR